MEIVVIVCVRMRLTAALIALLWPHLVVEWCIMLAASPSSASSPSSGARLPLLLLELTAVSVSSCPSTD